ncbi:acyl-CoA dehydrogenase family protein [Streptomyces thermocarboxydus]
MPKELGGRGMGVLGVAVAMEEIASVCASTALIFGASLLGQTSVLFSGDQQLQARFLPRSSGTGRSSPATPSPRRQRAATC